MARRKTTTSVRQQSGGKRLIASGKRAVLLGLPPTDHDRLRAAAAIERRPLTQFLIYHGLLAAEKILEKSSITA